MIRTEGIWRTGHPFGNVTAIIIDVTPQRTDLIANIKWGSNISVAEQKANSQYIVKAVNNHEALVKACESLVKALTRHLEGSTDLSIDLGQLNEADRLARAALKEAE